MFLVILIVSPRNIIAVIVKIRICSSHNFYGDNILFIVCYTFLVGVGFLTGWASLPKYFDVGIIRRSCIDRQLIHSCD
jgi:hypothetical protein